MATAKKSAAAEAAEVSMIDAQHICDTLVKMVDSKPIKNDFRKMIANDDFIKGEVVKVIGTDDSGYTNMRCLCVNEHGAAHWIFNSSHEPTTETF